MPNAIQQFFSGEITVDEDAWHYHIYKWWVQKTGGNSWGYRENLCHYMRVILLWAPLLWLGTTTVFGQVRAWMIATILLEAIVLWFIPPQLSAWVVSLTLLGVLIYFSIYHEEEVEELGEGLSLPFIFLWDHGIRGALSFFFTFGRWGIYPWSLTVVAFLALVCYLAGIENILRMLEIVGIAASVITGIIAVIILEYRLAKRLQGNRRYYEQSPARRRRQGSSTLKVVAHYLIAKKRKICPFIRLPD